MENMIAEEESTNRPVKILVVDDREDNLMSIETILEQDNYEIIKASSGKAALKILLHQHDFTLILMDVQMPDMDGIETANLIYQREKLRHIPIIFITAHNYNDRNIYEGYKVGAVDYIYKPINPELLRIKVGVFAELYQKNHQLMEQERKLKQANVSLASEIEERRISEEKVRLLNQQLLENNANLKTTVEELDRFAYVASHDLQEPLRKILVFSDKLLSAKAPLSEDVLLYMSKIVKASERMQKLINDLLIFSREFDGSQGYTEVDLNDIVEGVLSDMEVELDATGAIIKTQKLPVVCAVPSQMRQLFQNLISNGIKFRKPGMQPMVSIYEDAVPGSIIDDVSSGYHRIVVADNGIGFDEKYANDIFVVFKRLHSYHEYEGTGVGLSICKKIVERHNGRISAKSRQDEGTYFLIDFPKYKPVSQKDLRLDQQLSVEE